MSDIVLSGYILVPQEDLAAVRDALPLHRELTIAEPGCLVFQVDEDKNEAGKFHVYEVFTTWEAFEAHQARVKASEWGRISRDAERFYSVNEVSS